MVILAELYCYTYNAFLSGFSQALRLFIPEECIGFFWKSTKYSRRFDKTQVGKTDLLVSVIVEDISDVADWLKIHLVTQMAVDHHLDEFVTPCSRHQRLGMKAADNI